jgi:DGQHR domain-containing protein
MYGQVVDLGPCVFGRNLNTWTLRGYASIKVLADVSVGDGYDQYNNPGGTQRDLKTKHSQEDLDYALDSLGLTAEEDPRAFPEIILNVRDTSVITITDHNGNIVEFESLSNYEDQSTFLVRLRTSEIVWPAAEYAPQISRVDGNHRLSQAQDLEMEEDAPVPVVPFSMFVGLTTSQERKIFSDINGRHQGMPASIVTVFEGEALSDDVAVALPDKRAAWIARQLTEEGMVFYGKVFFGGSAKGVKQKFGSKPALTIQGLKSAVQKTLDQSPTLTAFYFPQVDLNDPSQNTEIRKIERVEKARAVVKLLNRYWSAVKDSYPAAWDNKKDYILFSSIGLMGFSHLAGPVLENLTMARQRFSHAHFKVVTDLIASQLDLNKSLFKGVAGAGGAKVVSDKLVGIWANSQPEIGMAIADLELSESPDPLDAL